jgi:phosphoserine phosphatase
MAIEGLGRLFNVVPIAASTLISMKDAEGITFVVTGDDTFTLKSAPSEAGSTTTLASITNYYTNTSTAGAAEWVAASQAAADTVVIASGAAAFYVDAADLPSAAEYVSVTPTGSGLVSAIVQPVIDRAPANLRALSGSSS